ARRCAYLRDDRQDAAREDGDDRRPVWLGRLVQPRSVVVSPQPRGERRRARCRLRREPRGVLRAGPARLARGRARRLGRALRDRSLRLLARVPPGLSLSRSRRATCVSRPPLATLRALRGSCMSAPRFIVALPLLLASTVVAQG